MLTPKFKLSFRFILSLMTLIMIGICSRSWAQDNADTASQDAFIFYYLRLPRIVLALIVGAALSVSGASFQALLKNPLADPFILGVSGGAALGYVLGVILKVPFFLMPALGFAFALASLIVIYRLAMSGGLLLPVNLLLTGVIFNSFSFALILMVNSLASFGQAQQILYLLLGSIEPVTWLEILSLSVCVISALAVLLKHAVPLNLLALGDEEAFHLGVDVEREKKIIFVTTSLLVGASVSLCGLIGFIGLFVPHLMRLSVGADHRRLLPACAVFGGLFLALADYVASHLFSWQTLQTRLPVGVITALIGAPVFVYLLKRTQSDHV